MRAFVYYNSLGSWGWLDPAALDAWLEQVAESGAEGPRNRRTVRRIAAIVPMHAFGLPVDMDVPKGVAERWGLPIVEDAAESLGSRYKGRPCGSFGLLSAVSFNSNKIVTAGGGSVIQTSSIYGMMAPDQRIYDGAEYMGVNINTPAVYSASKAGVHGLTRHLSTYWAAHRIRVNTLVPGGVESGQNETFKQRYGARIPLGRMAQAHEMVGAVVWLASDASSYVTGQAIHVDGGLSVW